MTVIQSLGTTADLNLDLWPKMSNSLSLYDATTLSYVGVYKTQPNVRVCVDFIARNIAQLGLHVYRRVSDTDRLRLADHQVARIIERPNLRTTRYRLMSHTVTDLGSHGNAYWLKYRPQRSGDLMLIRIPPQYVTPRGGLLPESYLGTWTGREEEYAPEALVHYRLDNPDNTVRGLSPMETLKAIIGEEYAATEYRQGLWKNSARQSAVVQRPATAPEWSSEARDRFRSEWGQMYAGAGNSGKTMVLEEGMTLEKTSFSPQEAEFLEGRQLTMEQAARMYHIPPPLVGILRYATYSNITEQHKMLYQDVLAPWLIMLQEEIELQLLPEFEDIENVYLEFNLEAKLAGSFEEQARALQSMVGGPVMTQNEGRARLNLPSKGDDGDKLITPLNVTKGGQASPQDSGSQNRADALRRFFARQEQVLKSNGGRSDPERWSRELAADLAAVGD